MPTFTNDPIQGVEISDADREAATVAPVRRAMLDCFELYHPLWSDSARFVNDKADFLGTLEADAPRDAGTEVLFPAIAVSAVWPKEGEGSGAPEVKLQVDGVSDELVRLLSLLEGSLDPIEAIMRKYASDDPSGPSRLPPLKMELVDVDVNDRRVTATLRYGDPTNDRFPAVAYTRAEYPGLSAR